MYLAGGTALALHLGHRRSVDLDFFSQVPLEGENLLALLGQIGMGRGSRRDFVDLYAVCQHGHRMDELHGWFQQKHRGISYDPYHLAKSLVYFVDAEQEPMPTMLWPCRWDEVKVFFIAESRRIFGG